MRCEEEQCPFWTGDGCACAVMDLDDDDRAAMKKRIGYPYEEDA